MQPRNQVNASPRNPPLISLGPLLYYLAPDYGPSNRHEQLQASILPVKWHPQKIVSLSDTELLCCVFSESLKRLNHNDTKDKRANGNEKAGQRCKEFLIHLFQRWVIS